MPFDPTMPFDAEAARAARIKNPNLTVFDTGEMYQPIVWPDRSGKVDFDNDESATEVTLFVHPSTTRKNTTTIQIDTHNDFVDYKLVLNEMEILATAEGTVTIDDVAFNPELSIADLRRRFIDEHNEAGLEGVARAEARMEKIFALFYDRDDLSEEQPFADLLADVIHMARRVKVDTTSAWDSAETMVGLEYDDQD